MATTLICRSPRTSETRPLSPYAASKLIGEVYCQTVYRAYGVPTVCLRYFNVYGPRQDPDGEYAAVIPRFLQRIKQGLPPIIYGDGLQTRDFVHVSDVVRANLLACEREEAAGQVLNVASGRGVSLLELAAALNELCHTHFTPRFEPARAGDIQHSRGDGSRLAAVLGFRPAISLTGRPATNVELAQNSAAGNFLPHSEEMRQMKSVFNNLLSWFKRNNRGEKIVAVVVLALAAFCMFYNLDLNPRPWQDEGSAAGIAKSLVQNGVYAIKSSDGYQTFGGVQSVGPTVVLPLALAYRLWGVGLVSGPPGDGSLCRHHPDTLLLLRPDTV